jgi:hypothetical protein
MKLFIIALVLVLLAFGSSGAVLCAQTVEIELVNGRSGRPVPDKCVNVWVGKERKAAMAIPTDKDGVASLRLTDKDSEINTRRPWKGCGDFGVINPVVKYDDSLRINAGYVLCQLRKPDYSWLATRDFSAKQVVQQGIVTANTCGAATASPKSGEVILFVRPLLGGRN